MPGYKGRYKYHKPPTLYEKDSLSPEDITQIRGLYDGSVASIDAACGRLFDMLKRNGLWENTIVIITADHGENLYESNWSTGHGEHLRGPHVVNIPCIIKFPKYIPETRTLNAVTRDIDIAPTLLDFLGHTPPQGMDGTSLLPLIKGDRIESARTAFTETGLWFSDMTDAFYQDQRILYPDVTGLTKVDFTYHMEVVLKEEYEGLTTLAKHRMIDDGTYRLIYTPARDGIRFELYRPAADPRYEMNLLEKQPQKAAELKKKLFAYMEKDKNCILRNDYLLPLGY